MDTVSSRRECLPKGMRMGRLHATALSDKMPDMRKVSVRELQQELRRVLELVQRGETVEITKRHRVIAKLSPVRPSRGDVAWPDLDARARAVLGDRILSPGGMEQILKDRGSW